MVKILSDIGLDRWNILSIIRLGNSVNGMVIGLGQVGLDLSN